MNTDDFQAILHAGPRTLPDLMRHYGLSYPFRVKRVAPGAFDCPCGCTRVGAVVTVTGLDRDGLYTTACVLLRPNLPSYILEGDLLCERLEYPTVQYSEQNVRT